MLLPCFPLPLVKKPPTGYEWRARPEGERTEKSSRSQRSRKTEETTFTTGLEVRDRFNGIIRCIVCGEENLDSATRIVERCHIIPKSEEGTWKLLVEKEYIPSEAKKGETEPRNGLSMCANHHTLFDGYAFFIRFLPQIRKYVLVNYSEHKTLRPYHGKFVALDSTHTYAPFPSIFIIHELRVRGFRPFSPTVPEVPDDPQWQEWIINDGLLDEYGNLKGGQNPQTSGAPAPGPTSFRMPSAANFSTSDGSRQQVLELDDNVLADILAATRAMPSWKACQVEGTSWSGTTEDNVQKYLATIGTENY